MPQHKQAFIFEDNFLTRHEIQRICQKAAFNFSETTFSSYQKAISWLETQENIPDLSVAILDIVDDNEPDQNLRATAGLRIAEALRRKYPTLPIIFYSAVVSDAYAEPFLERIGKTINVSKVDLQTLKSAILAS